MKEIKKQLDRIENKVDETLKVLTKSDPSKGKFVTCICCGYVWRTQSEAKLVSCPHCSNKTPNRTKKEQEEIIKERHKENPDYIKGMI